MPSSARPDRRGRRSLPRGCASGAHSRTSSNGAAGLDVYEHELHLTPGLTGSANVVLLPHLGSATTETRTRMALMAAENLIAMVQRRRPPNPLNPQLWP